MKARIQIGPGVDCDLDRLVNTRLLVQANSGAGKSWALRRLLEQTHGRIQQLVIDPEGEFASLREQFDYVLAARTGGDTLADPRTAKLLAERLLELGVSAIIDIYELKPHERIKFVKLFLDALVEAPKSLWHPALVLLDEAHIYAPEQGDAESADAVKSLATRGRKRGFCLIPATQRLSKLHKDVAAECNNKLIGRSSLDVDMKRAADELGFNSKEERLSLRDLEDGEFYAFGPALSRTVTKVKVGPVQTTHPKAGSHLAAVVPPPTERVRALLPKLSDLPAEAEAREKTVADLKRDNATLRRDLTEARKAQPAAIVTRVDVPVLKDAQILRLEQLAHRLNGSADHIFDRIGALLKPMLDAVPELRSAAADLRVVVAPARPVAPERPRPIAPVRPAQRQASQAPPVDGVTPAKQKILNALAFFVGIGVPTVDKTQLALMVGVSPTSGGYFNNLGSLRSDGLIEYPSGGTVALTDNGAAIASTDGVPETTDELHDAIKAKLPAAKWKILASLIAVYPKALTKDALAEEIDVSPTSGGYFNNLGSLRSLGLIDYPRPSEVVAKPVLFLDR